MKDIEDCHRNKTRLESFSCTCFDAIRKRHARIICKPRCVVSVEERIKIEVFKNIRVVKSTKIEIIVLLK